MIRNIILSLFLYSSLYSNEIVIHDHNCDVTIRLDPKTDLPSSEFTRIEGKIYQRVFYTWNSNRELLSRWIDDGKGESLFDLTGVTWVKTYNYYRNSQGEIEVIKRETNSSDLDLVITDHQTVEIANKRENKKGFWSFVDDFILGISSFWQSQKTQIDGASESISSYFESFMGEEHFFLWGLSPEKCEEGVRGKGEISPLVRVTGTNGMLNRQADCYRLIDTLSELHGGINVHYTYWPSEGWTKDLVHCSLAKAGIQSEASKKLASNWKRLIQDMGGTTSGGVIYHYCHSIGCATTSLSKELLTKEEQAMIRVFAFGPAVIIPNSGFQDVMNYISVRDGVSMVDPVAYLEAVSGNMPHVTFIGDHYGPPLVDHYIITGVYLEKLKELGQLFQDEFGSILIPLQNTRFEHRESSRG